MASITTRPSISEDQNQPRALQARTTQFRTRSPATHFHTSTMRERAKHSEQLPFLSFWAHTRAGSSKRHRVTPTHVILATQCNTEELEMGLTGEGSEAYKPTLLDR